MTGTRKDRVATGMFGTVSPRRLLSFLRSLSVFGLVMTLTMACGGGPAEEDLGNPSISPVDPPLAFPGAEGFGRFAKGGRGGRAIEVTNLNSSGPGSLRHCAEVEMGPRTCVFRIAGTIPLDTDDIVITNPFLTIAGQTAPGGGVTIKDGGLLIRASDVIVRYLRVRPGPAAWLQRQRNANGIGIQSNEGIAPSNIIVDHCSVSWGTDDLVYVIFGADKVTLQWNMFSEGLGCPGCGSLGLLIDFMQDRFLSVHHNLYAHIWIRFPEMTAGNLDMVNNVAYNSNGTPAQINPIRGPIHINFVGNYFKDGPDLVAANSGFSDIRLNGGAVYSPVSGVYLFGNIGRGRPTEDVPQHNIVWNDNGGLVLRNNRFDYPLVTATDALTARDEVLAGAGATLPARDGVDRRIISDVLNGTGKIITDPSQVGGWPVMATGTPPSDADHDGMPDSWELSHGLDPRDPNDGPLDADGNGYTNLEEYLNDLAVLARQAA